MSEKSLFQILSEIDITPYLKKKNNLSYLPWSSCWELIKLRYPTATYRSVKTETGNIYHTDGKTCWVETELTIDGETINETLAVMNHRNQSISAEEITSVDVNKSTKRCLVKNAALFGLGLSLWNGEELSDAAKAAKKEVSNAEVVLKSLKAQIVSTAKKLIDNGVDSASIYTQIENIAGNKNPNAIKDLEVCKEVIAMLEKIKVKK